jgi:predicted DNA-binding WGR domain protein
MRVKALGVALHYFDVNPDAGTNHDKYYRIYVTKTPSGNQGIFDVISHWGRDGSVNGQSKTVSFNNWHDAKAYAEKLGNSKVRRGYEWLGEKEIELDTHDLYYTGQRLVAATGRTPTKMMGFTMLIREEADLMELLSA